MPSTVTSALPRPPIGHHHRVIRKIHNLSGENNRIAELRAPQERMMWWLVALLFLLFSALDIMAKSTAPSGNQSPSAAQPSLATPPSLQNP